MLSLTASLPQVTRYRVPVTGLAPGLEGFSVLQISDLHGKLFGPDGRGLLRLIEPLRYNAAAITGDAIKGRRARFTDRAVLQLVDAILPVAPVYFVTGNHEWSSPRADVLLARLSGRGAVCLRNQSTTLTLRDCRVAFIGMDDLYYFGCDPGRLSAALATLTREAEAARAANAGAAGLRILLSHRPELFDLYRRSNVNLVLSGHAHGGQVRLPRAGGLFAPDQGLLPRYDAGLFRANGTTMVVSRGLGDSIFPWRINNPPEVVVVELVAQPQSAPAAGAT